MADSKKRGTASGTTKKTKSRSTTSSRAKKSSNGRNAGSRTRKVQETSIQCEIFLLCWFVFCFVLLLGMCGWGGSLTDWFTEHFYGWFGRVGILTPLVMFTTVFFMLAGANRSMMTKKTIFIIASFFAFGMLIHRVDVAIHKVEVVDKAYKYYGMASISHEGGGVICGFFSDGLTSLIGSGGTFVVCVAVLIVSFMVISRKSFFKSFLRGTQRWLVSWKEERAYRKELAEVERGQMEAQRRRQRQTRLEEARRDAAQGGQVPARREMRRESGQEARQREVVINRGMTTFSDIDLRKSMPDSVLVEETPMIEQEPTFVTFDRAVVSEASDVSEATENVRAPKKEKRLASVEPVEAETDETLGEQEVPAPRTRAHKPSRQAIDQSVDEVSKEIKAAEKQVPQYQHPPLSLLVKNTSNGVGESNLQLQQTAKKLEQVFKSFGVNVTVLDVSCGPAVTRYELQPEIGVKVNRIVALADDIKLNLAVPDIRIEAPIPGKAAVGIEVPNASRATVYLRELLESKEFRESKSLLAFPAGKDISGKVIVGDLAKMPHMLIAGTTGSGKSVFTNSIIMSMLFRADPKQVKFIVIDPKVVEFGVYNGIPHLMIPVVTDPKKAAGALNWAVAEMSERYKKFAEYHVRDLKGYNAKVAALEEVPELEGKEKPELLPQIVIIIDELADLMMVAAKEVEDAICRLAQLARAAGIHMIIATQRPSVDVVTGLIKANIPSRVALSVSSGVDSRTIIDMNGAEKLLGFGDMLFYPSGYTKPLRVQGAFVSDKEVEDVVNYLKQQFGEAVYDSKIEEKMTSVANSSVGSGEGQEDNRDPYFADAARFVIEKEKASIGMLQRMFKIGFNRAARIMDQLSEAGVVGPEEGTKPRKLLMTAHEFEEFYNNDKGELENED